MFFAENLHYEVFNLFVEKITNLEKKNPTVLTKLHLMSTAKQCGKKIFQIKLFAHEFITDFGLQIYGSFPKVAFCIFKDTLRVESADPQNGLFILFLKSDIKTYGFSAKLFQNDIYTAF